MCGISGYFSQSVIEPGHLREMNRLIRHRGPDGEGFAWFSPTEVQVEATADTPSGCITPALPFTPTHRESIVPENCYGGFGHRRLAIIDLEATGHQPMCTEDKRYWITYNGELYNYIELREELAGLGHRFLTHSDTEVILAAFRQWDSNCLERFNGMWAFVIHDRQSNTLFAARDRFGVKPFYYVHSREQFLFASELKALAGSSLVQTSINPAAVFDYFVFGQAEQEPEGFFAGITELPPSHCLILDLNSNRFRVERYYRLSLNIHTGSWDKKVFKEKAGEIRHLLEKAVQLRLRADVEVGSCLSGGLDSSAIVGLIRRNLPENYPLHVFTATFPGKTIDESRWALLMAEAAQAVSHTVSPRPEELLHDLEELMYCQDIPIWSTSTYAQFRVMKLVKESGIKVVLDGQGGDEVFAGYAPHHSFFWQELSPDQRRREMRHWEGGIEKARAFHRRQQARFDQVFRLPPWIAAAVYERYFPDIRLLNKDFYTTHRNRFALQRKYRKKGLNRRLALEMQNTSLKAYLKCEDRCSMWHGIEARTPFSDDHRLIEAAFALPSALKIHKGQSKLLLKEAMRDVLPDVIVDRSDKLGYATPNNEWLRYMAPCLKDQLFNSPVFDFINRQQLEKNYPAFFTPTGEQDTGRIFRFISFAVWARKYFG